MGGYHLHIRLSLLNHYWRSTPTIHKPLWIRGWHYKHIHNDLSQPGIAWNLTVFLYVSCGLMANTLLSPALGHHYHWITPLPPFRQVKSQQFGWKSISRWLRYPSVVGKIQVNKNPNPKMRIHHLVAKTVKSVMLVDEMGGFHSHGGTPK